MSARALTGLAGLVLLAAASWLLLREERRPAPAPAETAAERADYYFREAVLSRYTGEGAPVLELQAARIEHFPKSAYLALDGIRMRHRAADGTLWAIQAESGRMPDAGDIITLRGAVHIERLEQEPRLTVDTPVLELNLATDIARSEAVVTVREGPSRVHGTGMTLWLDEQRLVMESKVRGEYVR